MDKLTEREKRIINKIPVWVEFDSPTQYHIID